MGAGHTVPGHSLVSRLQKWVRRTAVEQNTEAFLVLNRQTIAAIAAAEPATFEALGKVKGMGPVKVHRYGRAILDLLAGEMD